jgi:hypothetical protein
MKEKSETYRKNIEKRGNVPNSITVRITLINLFNYRKKEINSQLDLLYLDFSFS